MGNSLSELLEEKGEEEQQQQQVKPKKQIIDVENLFYGEVGKNKRSLPLN